VTILNKQLLASFFNIYLQQNLSVYLYFSHLKEYNILREEQHGLQAGKSCETQLIMTIDDFANCLNDNSRVILEKHLRYHIVDFVANYLTMELEVLFSYG